MPLPGLSLWAVEYLQRRHGHQRWRLFAATGRVFSTTGTNANSATGTGPVTVNNGGILGGSIAGGAIGMPGTGPVTINAGGSLLPGGGWYVSSQGLGTGGYSTARVPTPCSIPRPTCR